MRSYTVVGYAADADTWCPTCADNIYAAQCSVCEVDGLLSRGWHTRCFGVRKRGFFKGHWASGVYIALDNEGNEVQPVFADSEWDYQPTCSACGAELEVTVLEVS